MNYRHIAFAVAFVCTSAAALSPACAGEPRAVIELFTSQGCSSCPAADKLMGKLASDPSLVTLSLPVDYWDYLGWKDTLALHGHSERQHAYAETRGDREVYTPQIVVNGVVHVLGSDKAAIEKAIAKTRQDGRTARLAGEGGVSPTARSPSTCRPPRTRISMARSGSARSAAR